MSSSSRLPAVIVYIVPVIGWLYVFLFQRKNVFAIYHLRQAVGLVLVLIGALVVWAVVAWVLAWIPLMSVISVALFTLVMATYLFGIVTWILGVINALSNRSEPLPGFGKWANRLPIR
jgi:uncharacterized membrane protein